MNDNVKQMIKSVRELEAKIEAELHRRQEALQYSIHNGRVFFEKELKLKNMALKKSISAYIKGARWSVIITAPIIYSLIFPLVLLDIFMSIYQAICFPIYGIPKVRRSDYLVFDRMMLDYLNGIQKINCAFCSYGNGILAFGHEVAARSEQYWCPIKHAKKVQGVHNRYPVFTDFGDGEQYHEKVSVIREMFDKADTPPE
jgi:LSD1 subclass zinc finger protein